MRQSAVANNTDTDSLMIKVKTRDIWAHIRAFNSAHENWIEDDHHNPCNGQLGECSRVR